MNLYEYSKILENKKTKGVIEFLGKVLRKINIKLSTKYDEFFKTYYWRDYVKEPTSVYFLKWIEKDGSGRYQSKYKYNIPSITNPPKVEHVNNAVICNSGFHCSDENAIMTWKGYDSILYIVEAYGNFDYDNSLGKISFSDIRVIERVGKITDHELITEKPINYKIENIEEYIVNNSTNVMLLSKLNSYCNKDILNRITVDMVINEFENSSFIDCRLDCVIAELLNLGKIGRISNKLYDYVLDNRLKFKQTLCNINTINDIECKRNLIEETPSAPKKKATTKLSKAVAPKIDKYTGKPRKKKSK